RRRHVLADGERAAHRRDGDGRVRRTSRLDLFDRRRAGRATPRSWTGIAHACRAAVARAWLPEDQYPGAGGERRGAAFLARRRISAGPRGGSRATVVSDLSSRAERGISAFVR